MSNQIELISDGEGVAVIGPAADVEAFLTSAKVESRALALNPKVTSVLKAGSGVAQAASEIAANSGRWVKLTEESAKAMKVSKTMMQGSRGDTVRAIVTNKGKTAHILEILKPGQIGSILTNPAMLAGAAGIMAQIAMQQQMDEITAYLKSIDEKVGDVLRAQKDAAIAPIIGVATIIQEAIELREETGRISDITWSKLQALSHVLATGQAHALRRLDALAVKFEKKSSVADLSKVAEQADEEVGEWLAVLAHCFQLQDSLALLELDRVLDASPEELEAHRQGLFKARSKRRAVTAKTTQALLERIAVGVKVANKKVLLHPTKSPEIVNRANAVAQEVREINMTLGLEIEHANWDARPWGDAAEEARDKTVEVAIDARDKTVEFAVDTADSVAKFSVKAFDTSKDAVAKAAEAVAERLSRKPEPDPKKKAKAAAATKPAAKKPATKKTPPKSKK